VIRKLLGSLLTLSLCLPAMITAQDQPEPPLRLKKKVRPQPEPAAKPKEASPPRKQEPAPRPEGPKRDEDKEEPDLDPQEIEQRIHDLMNRLSKNMRTAEQRLDKKDAGASTQQVQRDIVKDLEELIEQTRRRQQQQQQQSSSSSSPSSGQQEQQARRQRMQRNQSASARRRQKSGDFSQRLDRDDQANKRPSGGNGKRGDMSRIADLYKDIWGHLPEALRQEMDQYSREQFMAKYNELLKQYYSTIAEKGRRKDNH